MRRIRGLSHSRAAPLSSVINNPSAVGHIELVPLKFGGTAFSSRVPQIDDHTIRKGQIMKLFSAHIEDLRALYISNLKKALDMEEKITKALPDLVENSSDPELKSAFRNHLEETKGHVSKLTNLLRKNSGDDSTETCKVIDGLTTEASDIIKDVTEPSVRDIALIAAAQQVEHHEIAVYGGLRRWAEIIGLSDDASVLKSIEAEEGKADQTLTQISSTVNLKAAA